MNLIFRNRMRKSPTHHLHLSLCYHICSITLYSLLSLSKLFKILPHQCHDHDIGKWRRQNSWHANLNYASKFSNMITYLNWIQIKILHLELAYKIFYPFLLPSSMTQGLYELEKKYISKRNFGMFKYLFDHVKNHPNWPFFLLLFFCKYL